MKLVMIGSGYVGLVTGACFARAGNDVVCVDMDQTRVDALQRGEVPFFEPGLPEIVSSCVSSGNLTFATDLSDAVANADVVFIAVGTPSRAEDGNTDLSYIDAAAQQIGESLSDFTVIVTKSTVPVGTAKRVSDIISGVQPQADFAVVSNPEFLSEGSAVEDFQNPQRVVVGAHDERAKSVMSEIYRPFVSEMAPLIFTDWHSAEIMKYAANSFLATKITFINQIADLCDVVGADIEDIAYGLGLDDRIGSKFLKPGPGFGGSCFPKDALALSKTAQNFGAPVSIVDAVVEANLDRQTRMVRKIEAAAGDLRGKKIAVWGLTYKAGTDDMRDSASLKIIPQLQEKGASIVAFDPQGMKTAEPLFSNVVFADDAIDCVAGADILVVLTEWDEFRSADMGIVKSKMAGDVLVDLRNLFVISDMRALGFDYVSVGRSVHD